MNTTLKRVKLIGGCLVGAGVSMVIGNVIKSTTPINHRLIGKVFTWVGATAVTLFAGACAEKAFADKFDSIIDQIRDAVSVDGNGTSSFVKEDDPE